MRHILIVSNTSWFVYNFFLSSVTEFLKNGNRVTILAPEDNTSNKLKNFGCGFAAVEIDRSGMDFRKEVKTLYHFFKVMKKLRPDCVLNFTAKVNIYSTLAATSLRIPVVNSVAGLGQIFLEGGFKSMIGKGMLRISQPLAQHTVFQNRQDLNTYIKHHLVRPEKTSKTNGIGIQLGHFQPVEAPDDGVVRFVVVSRMIFSKGIAEFVKAAEKVRAHYALKKEAGFQVPEVEFALLGFSDPGNPQAISEEQLEEWHNQRLVNYLGSTDNVFDVVKKYDCVVLPSYYREGVPQCLIEAAAMAKPIITTDNPGCRDTVEHGKTGLLVQPRDVADLAGAMITLIELGHKQRLVMGSKARRMAAKDFCHLRVAQHYLDKIEQVCSSPQ
ncbi:glycosyltransferase family 4 protein [Marinobacter hydrocarbonoclasticus]|nr:glycosyltransferase family 4 protein [Marinobacter nauticus]